MALQKIKKPLSFSAGIDTKTDDKQLRGRLLDLENGRFVKKDKIQKRFGTTSFTTDIQGGGSLSNITNLTSLGDELICLADKKLYKYSEVYSKWVLIANAASASISEDSRYTSAIEFTSAAISGNYLCITGTTSGPTDVSSKYTVIDKETGGVLVNDERIDTAATNGGHCKVFANDNKFFFVWYDVVTNNKIYYRTLDTDTLALSAISEIATATSGLQGHDYVKNGNSVVIAFLAAGGTTDIAVYSIDIDSLTSTNTTISLANTTTAIGLFADSLNRIWCTFGERDGAARKVRGFTLDSDLSSIMSPTDLITSLSTGGNVKAVYPIVVTDEVSSGKLYTYLSYKEDPSFEYTRVIYEGYGFFNEDFSGTFTTLGQHEIQYQSAIFNKPFSPNNEDIYVPLIYIGNGVATAIGTSEVGNSFHYIIKNKVESGPTFSSSLVAKFLKFNTVRDLRSTFNTELAVDVVEDDGNYILPCLRVRREITNPIVYSSTSLITLDIDNIPIIENSENKIIVSGAVPKEYDGVSFSEVNFLKAPEIRATSETSLGFGFPSGTYTARAYYEWRDKVGNAIRSEMSSQVSHTQSVTGSINLTIENISMTDKVAEEGDNKLFIRVFINDGSNTYSYTREIEAAPSSSTVTEVFIDTAAGSESPYVDSGELENSAPEDAEVFHLAKNRMFYVSNTQRKTVYYSKIIPETGQLEFSPSLFFDVVQEGDIVALSSLDDKLIIFKNRAIFAVGGSGPDNNGNNNDFTAPTLISSDTGCEDPSSVVLTANGLMFKSAKGIQLLSRQLSISYIGDKVEDYNNETVNSSVMMDDYNEVRFFTDNRCLVYNYYFGEWSTFSYSGTTNTIFDGVLYFANSSAIKYEDPSLFTDLGEHIKLTIVSPWFSLSGLQGLQRIYRLTMLGEYISDHSLRISVGYDFEDSYTDTIDIDSASEYSTSDVYQMEINFSRQKCEAFRVKIEDIQTLNFGEGLSLSSLLLTYGVKRRSQALRGSRTFTTD